ncbi:SDR family NAD(P)-dependent oxidoreductase [Chelatococcus reniformis]|uniref:2-dehydro-3-deoxy-D-gluconate 5-dehydrogenase n=1 Tax=Chelatococcus reniformis TaxID=1494448 RepID=A0A916X812_9HYPH|nr:SDR family NAD(P)-dependent oxidoreductase [Chelatococcus reniformis]GGC48404.1 2-dehydro-3-deoxy-D-gluconate 5-dehydrogenase [Chelatococcus reniformis]
MLNDIFKLDGKCALVVGGGQGMGASTALLLASVGCNVAVVDVVEERAKDVATKIAALGRTSAALQGDILKISDTAALVQEAERKLGGLDILVSIVGQARWASVLEVTPDLWDIEHDQNLRSFFFLGQAFARHLVDQGQPGAITCITSVSGVNSSPRHAPYGAAKAGLIQLVKTMAVEFAKYDIRVNSVAPGSIITPRLPETEETDRTTRKGPIPMKRRGTTDEIAKAILFLSSDLASYVTGHTLLVDGGWMAANISVRPD